MGKNTHTADITNSSAQAILEMHSTISCKGGFERHTPSQRASHPLSGLLSTALRIVLDCNMTLVGPVWAATSWCGSMETCLLKTAQTTTHEPAVVAWQHS